MKCVLAAMGFINEDIRHNKNVILDTMKRYSGQVDIVIFGEAFLQGFYRFLQRVENDGRI